MFNMARLLQMQREREGREGGREREVKGDGKRKGRETKGGRKGGAEGEKGEERERRRDRDFNTVLTQICAVIIKPSRKAQIALWTQRRRHFTW